MGGDSDSPEFPYMLETKTIGVDPYQAPDRQDLILSAGAPSMALLSSQWSKMRCTRASGEIMTWKIAPGEDTYSLGVYPEPLLDKPIHTTLHERRRIHLTKNGLLEAKGLCNNVYSEKKCEV